MREVKGCEEEMMERGKIRICTFVAQGLKELRVFLAIHIVWHIDHIQVARTILT